MALTSAQRLLLKNDIASDPVLSLAPMNDDGHALIAEAYNAPASPVFIVWRRFLPADQVKIGVVWTEFVGRSAGERDAFVFMLSGGVINPSDANIRQGIADIFSGPSGAVTRTNLTALSKRNASRAERLFGSGVG